MYSPHDVIIQAEELKNEDLKKVKRRLRKIVEDVEEINEFLELLGQCKL